MYQLTAMKGKYSTTILMINQIIIIIRFNQKLLEFDETTLKPIFIDKGITYFHTAHNNVRCNI